MRGFFGQKKHYFFSRLTQLVIFLAAVSAVFLFGLWWFTPSHIPQNFLGRQHGIDILLFFLVSYIIWHFILMDVLTWCISLHIKTPRLQKPIPNKKVAFITTIVPQNEPMELLHKCLPAMVQANYPHDTWLLDEGNDPQIQALCARYGVKHFSRAGQEKYNTPQGKFTKTKGGNHNAWYATYGNSYDFVAQIDTDFVPSKNFLTKTLGYFRDQQVAFVGTPQIYGNVQNSFIARGAFEQQLLFYGAVLRGLSSIGMTILIGANHVIRVSAFKKVDHYTAHVTEDLVTGMKLHAQGFTSLYVPEQLAVGEGPATWGAYFTQQFRWAYGCVDILLHHSFKHLRKMKPLQAIYYFFLAQHYFSGLAMTTSLVLLSLYFLFGIRAANVDLFTFFLFYSGILCLCWLMSIWLQQFNIEKTQEGELFLFGKLISIAAWPIWFLASLQVLFGKRLTYKVTPKGNAAGQEKATFDMFTPHIFFGMIATTGLISALFTHRQSMVMLFWAASAMLLMLCIPFLGKILAAISFLTTQAQKVFTFLFERYNTPTSANQTTRFATLQDSLFLFIIVCLSSLLYVSKLGFYSDDWSFLGNFTLSKQQNFFGFYQTAVTPNTFMRPVQNVYDAFLFTLFGTHPLGYQLVNVGVFSVMILLFYFILRKLQLPRIIAVSIPLLFALLPNYSTDRFWYAAFQVNLSILFFLLSLLAGLQAFAQNTKHMFFWKIVSIASLLISTMSYEVAIPLVAINLLLFWNPLARISSKKKQFAAHHTVFIAINLLTLFYIVIFKAKTTVRLGKFNYPTDAFHLLLSVIHTNFWTLGVHVPAMLSEIATKYLNRPLLLLAICLYVAIFLYLFFVLLQKTNSLPNRAFFFTLMLIGIVIFFLGYAIFLTNNQVGFSATGIDNRVAIAATIGIAFLLVGALGILSRLLFRGVYTEWFFCLTVALVCTSGFLVINTIAQFWILAYQKGTTVLSDIQTSLPYLPNHTIVILDGVCPYVGPGIVFESQWDLKGALQVQYHNPTIQADIITPRLKITKKGIVTQIYTFRARYPYKNLVIFNDKQKKAYPIHTVTAAKNYFEKYNPDFSNGCPNGQAGNGVTVL